MPKQTSGNRPYHLTPEEEEYRRRQEAKARRRKKRRMQKIMLLGAFALAAVLLILCIVMVVRAIIKPKTPASSLPQSSSIASSAVMPIGGSGVSWPVAADSNVWNLILVNPQVAMPDGFDPELAPVSSVGHMFDARAAGALKQMVADCNAVEEHSLEIDSGYRGPETQGKKYNDLVTTFTAQGMGQEEAAAKARQIEPPYGYSDHQTGLGVDFKTGAYQQVDAGFASTPEYAWLMQHCTEYGFILRFPENKTAITGIEYQPYHFRYVGNEDAAAIMQSGICLEEYLMALPETPDSSLPPDDTGLSGDAA